MIWISEHPSIWRVILIALMAVAFMGPWVFDLIHVPSKYPCSDPFIRLEGDYCGMPRSGILLFPWVVVGFISSAIGLVAGDLVITRWIPDFLNSMLLLIPLLPVFNTFILILRGDHRRLVIFTKFTWVLAIGFVLFWGLNSFPKMYWRLWGIWLYIGLATGALILEILAQTEANKINPKSAPALHS